MSSVVTGLLVVAAGAAAVSLWALVVRWIILALIAHQPLAVPPPRSFTPEMYVSGRAPAPVTPEEAEHILRKMDDALGPGDYLFQTTKGTWHYNPVRRELEVVRTVTGRTPADVIDRLVGSSTLWQGNDRDDDTDEHAGPYGIG